MFEELLARLTAALRRHGIPHLVIGGQAVLLQRWLEEFDAAAEHPVFVERFRKVLESG